MCVQNLKSVALPVHEIIGGRPTQKIRQSLDTRTLPFLQTFNGLLFGWTLWINWPNLKSVAFPAPEIIGVTQKNLGTHWIRPCTFPFLQNVSWALIRIDSAIVLAKLKVRSFTRSWDNSDWIFGWGLRTPNLGEGEAVGVGDGTVRKSVGEFL